MKARALAVLLLTLLSTLSFAQTVEKHVDFTVSPGVILDGSIHVAFEWISPANFRNKSLSQMDLQKISALHPNNNQMIVSKIAFISKTSFDNLTYAKMNNANYIAEMLNSVSIRQKTTDTWSVTNKVKAYSIPFKVSFDFKFKEVTPAVLGASLVNYIKDEASGLKGTGRERFMTLDMTNFSQLMYRNYSIVYMKEISPTETMIVSGIIAGFNLQEGNTFFNLPPFSTTKSTMMGNLKTQIMQMAHSIQN
ncbi:MAG: hypothetical protein H0V66_06940 [Bdellovibrionales bacterium]|nr:hypothetical protein [Bdellovibrionales bacterium]